jgi:Phage tail lysozyme
VATARELYDALTGAGFDKSQAIGLMANAWHESGFDQEVINPAGPQSGVGLFQWQTTDYPAAARYVTGNPARDLQTQVQAIRNDTRRLNLSGSAQQVAGTVAADFERCAGCQPGGAQYAARTGTAGSLWGEATRGSWTVPAGSGVTGGGSSGGATGATAAEVTAFLSAPAGVLKDAGALVHGTAVVLDRAFALFAPGQGWRITFGAAALLMFWLAWRAFT